MPQQIPDLVRRFILTSVPSVPFLEAARLFHASPGNVHSASSLSQALYAPEVVAQRLIEELVAAGIVAERDAGHAYSPRDADLAAVLDQLFAVYQADLIGVTHLIHGPTLRNAERFANAFRWRKDADHG